MATGPTLFNWEAKNPVFETLWLSLETPGDGQPNTR
jgi:hypothetical protein